MKCILSTLTILILFLSGCGGSEQQLYQQASTSGLFSDYKAYLDKYPDGTFSIEIKGKLEELRKRMKYIITIANWEFLSNDYKRDYRELYQIFVSQNQNIRMTGSATDVKWAWQEVMKLWEMPPIKQEHFDQINALGCWTREIDASGEGNALSLLLPMYAKGILQKKILESTAEDARLLKQALLDWIVDMSYFTDFREFLIFMRDNEKDVGVLGNVDEVMVKIRTVY